MKTIHAESSESENRYKYLLDILETKGLDECLCEFYFFVDDDILKMIAVKLTAFCAHRTQSIFAKQYPDDKRPIEAIQAAEKWIDDPSESTATIAMRAWAHANAASDENINTPSGSASADASDAAFAAAFAVFPDVRTYMAMRGTSCRATGKAGTDGYTAKRLHSDTLKQLLLAQRLK